MKDDRKRQPIKDDYAHALGMATYCFALCEWQVVWCSEKIKPGSLAEFARKKLTAGLIANQFIILTENTPPSKEQEELSKAANQFGKLVDLRNQILHGKPCEGPNGEARLSSQRVLEIAELEEAADSFSACSIELNRCATS